MRKINYINRSAVILRYLLLALMIGYIAVYLSIVCSRITYPFELEWVEGGMLIQVGRIMDGELLYTRPTFNYIPLIYAPAYFYVSAAAALLTGPGFLPLRLVSFSSSLGSMLIIFLLVRKETGRSYPAIISAGLYAGCFEICSAWFDIGRVDSLFLFLLLLSAYIIKGSRTPAGGIIAGVFMVFAFFTKQSALILALPLIIYSISRNRKVGFWFGGTIILGSATGAFLLDYIHQGWYSFFTFVIPSRHFIFKKKLLAFWLADLPLPLGAAWIAGLIYPAALLRRKDWNKFFYYFLFLAGMIGISWAGRLNPGGWVNVLMPAFAALSLLFGLSLNLILEKIPKNPATLRTDLLRCAVYAFCIAQFSLLAYDPYRYIPTEMDLEGGKKIIQTLRAIPGDVHVPYHNYLTLMAGKKGGAHWVAMVDVLGGLSTIRDEEASKLDEEIDRTIREERFAAILLDRPWREPLFSRHYKLKEKMFSDSPTFIPVTGWAVRPKLLYVARGRSE